MEAERAASEDRHTAQANIWTELASCNMLEAVKRANEKQSSAQTLACCPFDMSCKCLNPFNVQRPN